MSHRTTLTRAAFTLATVATAALLSTGTASAAGGFDWDIFPSGSAELGPPTGSAGSVDIGLPGGSVDADFGSGAPKPPASGSGTGSGTGSGS